MELRLGWISVLVLNLTYLGKATTVEDWNRQLAMGRSLFEQGKYEEARRAFEEARDQAERTWPSGGRLAIALNNLGTAYLQMHDLAEAERCYRRSAGIWEGLGDVTNALAPRSNVAAIYLSWRQYSAADRMLREDLDLATSKLGPEHQVTGSILAYLAKSAFDQHLYAEAARLSERVIPIVRKTHAAADPDVAVALGNLGAVYRAQGKTEEASRLFQEAMQTLEMRNQPEHPAWVRALDDAGSIELTKGDYPKAEILLERAMSLAERTLSLADPVLAGVLHDYAMALRYCGKKSEARKLESRARKIQEAVLRADRSHLTVDIRGISGLR